MAVDLRLYALVDPAVAGGRTLVDLARRLTASATLVQLRDKHGSTRAMIEEARDLRAVLEPEGIPLLVNDRVDVALAAEADGVHIGQDDMPVPDARLLLGRSAIIGLSVKTVEQAKAAPLELLDYVAIGGVYGTTSKDNTRPPIGTDGLRTIVDAVRARKANFPICAIAGINAANAADVIAAGADGVAVISALSLAPTRQRPRRNCAQWSMARWQRREAVMTAIAVTIAGSDSGGGAGIQADLKTFGALGVYGASVIVALTAQNTQGVSGIHDVPADFITAQMDAVFSDLDVDAVKIGMLSQAASIEAVAKGLADHRAKNIVLDPVMVATSGDRLLAADAVDALRKLLIPRALVITPNLPEAAALVGASPARNEKEMEIQARELLALGARNVLIKGGHGDERRECRSADRAGRRDAPFGQAHRHQKSAWYRLHVVIGDRGGIGQGARPQGGEPPGQGLCHRRDRGGRYTQDRPRPRAAASFLSVRERRMTTRRNFTIGAGLAAGVLAAPAVARAQTQKWRMVTSWPKRLPGPGHVGRAHRRAHSRALRRQARHHRSRGR